MNVWKRSIQLKGVSDSRHSPFKIWMFQFVENWGIYIGGCLAVIVTDFAEIFIPKLVSQLIDLFVKNTNSTDKIENYTKLTFVLLGILAFQFTARVFWRLLLAQQTHYVAARMKSLLWEKVRYFPNSRIETDLSPGELMNVATGDVAIARFLFGFTLVGTVDFIFLLIFCLSAMFSIDPYLSILCLASFPVLPFILHKLAKKEGAQHSASQTQLSLLSDLVAQSISTTRLQKVTETSGFWKSKLVDSADSYRAARVNLLKTAYAFIPVTGIPPLLAYLVLLYFGVQKVIDGQLSLGSFIALQSYIFIIQGPLLELGTLISEWQRGFTSLSRYLNILRQAEESQLRSGGIDLHIQDSPIVPLEIKINHLDFSYPNAPERKFYNGLSLALKPGDRWGILGPVGSGKTTLVKILSGLQKNYSGEITLNSIDIKNLSHKSLRNWISVVPQKPFLFASTVEDNLKLDNPNLGEDQIQRALSICGLDQEVAAFPQGIKTKLGEWGINLSGGQKQRLTLARALLRNPRVLFLDDCLSAVDTVTEEKILTNLNKYFSDQIVVWVAHRESTLRFCNLKTELRPQ